jgi:hypothetical protein
MDPNMPKISNGASKISGNTGSFLTQRHILAKSIRRRGDSTSLVAVAKPPDNFHFPSNHT